MQTIRIDLPRPHTGQRKVLGSKARFRVLMCGRRWGKSLISKQYTITEALDGKINAYITPNYSLAKVFFDEIAKIIPNEVATINKSDLVFKFVTGGEIRFFTGERLDNLRGLKFHNVIIDEACYIPNLEDAWNNAIRPTLTDYQGRALFISTPRGKDFFYRLYLRSGEKDFESFKYTTYDNPFINDIEIDDAKRTLPDHVFRQEYLAEFVDGGASLFPELQIDNNAIPSINTYGGLDVGRADDYTVLSIFNDVGKQVFIKRWRQMDWSSIIREVVIELNRFKPQLMIEINGVGDPIFEQVQKAYDGYVYPFQTNSKSKQDIIEQMIVANNNKEFSILNEAWLVSEFNVFTYEYNVKTRNVRYAAPHNQK